jgi:hypothetical protein
MWRRGGDRLDRIYARRRLQSILETRDGDVAAMSKFVFGMNVSLDGYVDHQQVRAGRRAFRHWIDAVAGLAGSLYGRRVYDLMRYWDEDPSGLSRPCGSCGG